jgi:hypothetical protein
MEKNYDGLYKVAMRRGRLKETHGFNWAIKIDGKKFYWITSIPNEYERLSVADEWREHGFHVRIKGNYIYARRK